MGKANSRPRVAIVGSTGLVGRKITEVLCERKVRARFYYFNSQNKPTETAVAAARADFALMAVSAELSAVLTPLFVRYGATVIDNSSHYRMEHNVPLVIPEINPNDIWAAGSARIIANPNCSTIGAAVALAPLDKKYKIRRIVYSTYQAISGAGANPEFAYPIENNVLPQIDEFVSNGNTKEEEKIINETKKILHRPDIAVSATAVRVPVANCHCVSINVEFEMTPVLDEVKKILASAPGVVLVDDPENKKYPIPTMADGQDMVFVGRVRLDNDRPNAVNLWTAVDNLRKGAATNAVQILELLLRGRNA